jgi:hypothetical protein
MVRVPDEPGKAWAAGQIAAFLAGHRSNVCLVQDRFARPRDPFLARFEGRIRTHEDEVYHLISGSDPIADLLAAGGPDLGLLVFMICAAASLGEELRQPELSEETLTALAESTVGLVLDVYDFESRAVWWKGRPSSQ